MILHASAERATYLLCLMQNEASMDDRAREARDRACIHLDSKSDSKQGDLSEIEYQD